MRKPTRKRGAARLGLIVAAAFIALLLGAVARADDISNNLDGTIDAVAEVMPLQVGGANGTTNLYVTPRNGDGKNGCNLTGSSTLVLSISSSNASAATVSPSSVTFGSCGDVRALTVTPVAQGSATISASQTSNTTGGSFNLAPATFTVNVTAPPPANTPPQVSVSGVSGGTNYEKGSVPSAMCVVTDAEDGNSSFPATLSAVSGPYASDGIGTQTASCSYTDGGGVTAQASETYGIVDPSAPGISYLLSPPSPDGSNGWYRSDVGLTWTLGEPESPSSLLKTGCVDQSITADQPATSYSCSATSAGGSAGPVSVSIKRDATSPTIIGSRAPAANGAGWNNEDVSVSFACDDNLSGMASCGPDQLLFSEGADQSATGTATDEAGNSETATVTGISIDKTKPSIVASRSPEANGAGWSNEDVSVSFACDDNLSGVVSCGPDQTFSSEGADQSATGSATDKAGNSESATLGGINIDKTKPTITGSASPAANGAGWNNEDVTVSFVCNDGLSGIASCEPDHVLSSNGAGQSVTGTAADKAENGESATVSGINIDKVDPSIAGSIAPAAPNGANGWYVTAPTVSFACADDLSGVASCSDPVTLGESASAQAVGGTAADVADNTAAASVSGVHVDLSDPVVECGPTPTFLAGQLGSVHASVSDSISGAAVASVSAPATSSSGGSVSLTGYDNAGRSTTVSCPYHVIGATFLQPINGRPTVNIAKLGRVIPVKVQILYDGVPQTNLNTPAGAVTIGVATTSCTFATEADDIEAYAAGSSNSGVQFRWDALGGFWIYNLDTSSFAMKVSTCYQGSVYLDGTKAGYFFVKVTK